MSACTRQNTVASVAQPDTYFEGLCQSSIHHGHQLLGLACVVPFLMTLIFMAFPFWF